MNRYIKLISGVIFLMLLAACQGETQPAQTKLEKGNSGQVIEVNKGEQVVITLEGNPTTGYTWETKDLDDTILKHVGEPAYETSSSAVGAGGIYTFTFQAISTGETTLKLIYFRPFETDTPPIDTFEVTIVVK